MFCLIHFICFNSISWCKTGLLLQCKFWSSYGLTRNVWQKFLVPPFLYSFPLGPSFIKSSELNCNRCFGLWPLMAAQNNENKSIFFKLSKLVIYFLALLQAFNWSVILSLFIFFLFFTVFGVKYPINGCS